MILKDRDLTQAISDHIIRHCDCNFTRDLLTNRAFECSASSPHDVTYRAQLLGTADLSPEELLRIVERWVAGGPTLSIHLRLIDVDSSCAVRISSFREPSCGGPGGPGDVVVLGGVVVGVVVALVLAAAATVLVVMLWRRFHQRAHTTDPM